MEQHTTAPLPEQLRAMLAGERDAIANAANAAALIYHGMPDLNWTGFYFLKHDQLVLGPFQGRPACVRIALDRGVCGHAATTRQTTIVPDVQQFPGHIACDSNSRSELVVPLIKTGELRGVIDLDSPELDRFTRDDAQTLEELAAIYVAGSDL